MLSANPLCVLCLKRDHVTLAVHVDHIIAITNGGSDDPHDDSNRQGLCDACHEEKTREDLGYKPIVRIGMDGYPIDEMEGE